MIETFLIWLAELPEIIIIGYCCGLPYVIYGIMDWAGINSRLGISIKDVFEEIEQEEKKWELYDKLTKQGEEDE